MNDFDHGWNRHEDDDDDEEQEDENTEHQGAAGRVEDAENINFANYKGIYADDDAG